MGGMCKSFLKEAPLGRRVNYEDTYNPGLLFPVARKRARDQVRIGEVLPFSGVDIWNGFELSWLNVRGKPCVAMAEMWVPVDSPNLIESKSLKLYLNSFNQTIFDSEKDVEEAIACDLTKVAGAPVEARLLRLGEVAKRGIAQPRGLCLDGLDVAISCYEPAPDLLRCGDQVVKEVVYSDLLKSNCLITGQPDWASVEISYKGPAISHESLLQYIVSFRKHCGFHEACVEQMFVEILERCRPERLTVFARYTRRGGLDINPFRSNFEGWPENLRFVRQ